MLSVFSPLSSAATLMCGRFGNLLQTGLSPVRDVTIGDLTDCKFLQS